MRKFLDMSYAEGENDLLDLYLPDGECKAVYVSFHGGGLENCDRKGDFGLMEVLVENGMGFASVEYSLYPNAKFPQFIEDAAKAINWLKKNIKNYADVDNIFIGGQSAGAYMSMLLCFDKRYLGKYGITQDDISGWIFNGGQPTTHFNVLKERGIMPHRVRVIVDDAAPLYYVDDAKDIKPIFMNVAENDIACRYEQNMVFKKALEMAGYDMDKLTYLFMEGFNHCAYIDNPEFGYEVVKFMEKHI